MLKNRNVIDHIRLVVLFTFIYVILNETLSWLTVGLGVASGLASIVLTNKILEIDYVEMFHINLALILTYFWIILRDSYVGGIDVLIRTFKGNVQPNIIPYKIGLKDEALIALFANGVTMPPGSIVVDRDGSDMSILTVGYDPETFVKDSYRNIEKLLAKFDSGEV